MYLSPSILTDELPSLYSLQLCNVLGHSYLWVLDEDSELILDTKPMVHISLLLLGYDEHNSPGTIMDHLQRTPTMLQVGLSLAHNIALYPNVSMHPVEFDVVSHC